MNQLKIDKRSAAYWTVTFDNPPINTIGPEMILELRALLARLETDEDVRVVVFESADPDYFLAHWDMLSDPARMQAMETGPTGLPPLVDALTRLSRVPVATISKLRGRARGAGSEFALATDMRFAGPGAILGQFEVGVGANPGGGAMERLARLVGRGRALEVLLTADDYQGAVLERYGYVNRVVDDDELDGFVDAMARRIASFPKWGVATTKRFVDVASLPRDDAFGAATAAFYEGVGRDETKALIGRLIEDGLQERSDTEAVLGSRLITEQGSTL